VSNFAENLRKVLFDKRLKAIDVARGTNITPSVISRYLSGTNQPSRDNLFAVANYLGVSSEWLLSSSEAPESKKPVQSISPHQDKIIGLLEQMVADKDKQNTWLSKSCDALADEVRRLEAQVGMLKAQNDQWMASGEVRHPKGKTKNPTKSNKQKVGFMKKHKKPKK
jgi:transcriptional regulator with XRE-family HTH domain